jgi:hypothetical protein
MALGALALFALVWFFALHRPGAGTSPSHVSVSSASPSSSAKGPAAATPVYHGSAPGVEGLTRAVAKAHGTVANSEKNAAQLQSKSEQASSPSVGSSNAGSATSATGTAKTGGTSVHHAVVHHTSVVSVRPAHHVAHKVAPVVQAKPTGSSRVAHARVTLEAALKHELKQGKILLLLFWNPQSSDDVSVRHQLSAAAAKLKGKVAVHVALAGQVGQYGSLTRNVQVFGTPTLLIVGKHGLTSTVTGLLDAYGIEQAVSEASRVSAKA